MIYKPGDYVCVDITAHSWNQIAADEAIRYFTRSRVCHSFLITSEDGEIIQATPSKGVDYGHISEYDGMPKTFSTTYLTDAQRKGIVNSAKYYVGRDSYGFLDIVYLGLYLKGYNWNWLESEVLEEKNRTICSQLVAMCGQDNGINSWLCGKQYPILVAPADLDNLAKIQAR